VIAAGGLAQDSDGVIYSPFILKELESSHLQALRGKKGGNPGLSDRLNQPDKREVKPTEQNSKEQNNTTTVIIAKKHEVPDAAAFPLANYQTEVLNKCTGREAGAEHPRGGLLFLIAKHVPREHVMAALGSLQDARNRNLNPDPGSNPVKDLERYYFGTVHNLCRKHGIDTPINWNGGAK